MENYGWEKNGTLTERSTVLKKSPTESGGISRCRLVLTPPVELASVLCRQMRELGIWLFTPNCPGWREVLMSSPGYTQRPLSPTEWSMVLVGGYLGLQSTVTRCQPQCSHRAEFCSMKTMVTLPGGVGHRWLLGSPLLKGWGALECDYPARAEFREF